MVVREAWQIVRDKVDASPIDEGAVRGHGDEHRPAAMVRHADDGSVGELTFLAIGQVGPRIQSSIRHNDIEIDADPTLLTFIEANLGMRESPLHPAIEATHRSQRSFGLPNLAIGLGWLIRSQYGRDIVWHNGGTGGYGSFVGFDMASGTGVVVLSNATNSPDDLGFYLLDQRFELVRLQNNAPRSR